MSTTSMEVSLSGQNHNRSSFVAPLTLTSSIGHKKFCVTWSSIEVLKQDKRVIGGKFYETAPVAVAKSYNSAKKGWLSVSLKFRQKI